MRNIVLFIITAVIFSSCEKNITIQSQGAEPLLVVEATIENGQDPVVILSKSMDYFGKISPELLSRSFVKGATVIIGTGSTSTLLKEFTLPLGNGYTFTYYTVDPAVNFKGQLNTSYNLSVTSEGKTYTATTTIPEITRRLDSLWWKPVPNTTGPDTNWVAVMVKAYDKPGLGDYIRYYTRQNSGQFLPGDPSVFDDDVIDGTQYEIQVARGKDRNAPNNDGDFSTFFRRGDTVTFKTCNIDKATFDFWRTMEYTYQSIGNPFASPVKVLSNIKGPPALGYFGGYAAQYKTIIIPK